MTALDVSTPDRRRLGGSTVQEVETSVRRTLVSSRGPLSRVREDETEPGVLGALDDVVALRLAAADSSIVIEAVLYREPASTGQSGLTSSTAGEPL